MVKLCYSHISVEMHRLLHWGADTTAELTLADKATYTDALHEARDVLGSQDQSALPDTQSVVRQASSVGVQTQSTGRPAAKNAGR